LLGRRTPTKAVRTKAGRATFSASGLEPFFVDLFYQPGSIRAIAFVDDSGNEFRFFRLTHKGELENGCRLV
jgi:hypothetical protein